MFYVKKEIQNQLKSLTFENFFSTMRQLVKEGNAVEVHMGLKLSPFFTLSQYSEYENSDNWTMVYMDIH